MKINELSFGLLIVALSLAVGVSSADAADLVFDADTTVTIGSANYTITSGSVATSVAPGASSIEIVMPDNAYLTFKSTDSYTLNNTYGSASCGAAFCFVFLLTA